MFKGGSMDNQKILKCDGNVIHSDIVERVQKSMPDDNTLYNVVNLLKAFGDFTRIRILFALYQAEMCVCDISCLLNMTISAVSHQLRVLRNNNLVKYRRDGKEVFYSLSDDHIYDIIELILEHTKEQEVEK